MFKKLLFIALFFCFVSQSHATDYLTDSFESGDLNNPGGTTGSWGAQGEGPGDDVSISSTEAHTGTYSLRFTFGGDYPADAYAEQVFSIGTGLQELWVDFWLRWPSNYASPNGDNNKFLMVWSSEGQTSSLFYDLEYDNVTPRFVPKTAGNGTINTCSVTSASHIRPLTTLPNIDVTAGWRRYTIYMRIDTGSGDGFYIIYEDGAAIYTKTDIVSDGAPCDDGFLSAGYLLGWANSGFEVDTIFYIDDVKITDVNPIDPSPTTPTINASFNCSIGTE